MIDCVNFTVNINTILIRWCICHSLSAMPVLDHMSVILS